MGGMGPDEKVKVGMIVISASTGDVVWDEFEGVLTSITWIFRAFA